jgi:hypothetical protein
MVACYKGSSIAENCSTNFFLEEAPMKRRSFLKGTLATAPLLLGPGLLASGEARADQGKGGGPRVPHNIGPSTKTEPYLVPSVVGVQTLSILTVGDSVDGYRMVGIPDGLGAFEGPRNSFTLLSNHEIIATLGIPRAHGSKGAFVSAWTINPKTLEVTKGEDLTPSADAVHLWDQASGKYVAGTTTIWERLCSADLAKEGAFSYRGFGTKDRIFLNGEEVTQGWGLGADRLGQAQGRSVAAPAARARRLRERGRESPPAAQDGGGHG